MKKSVRDLFINVGVMFVTFVILILVCEFIVFRFILKASDYPELMQQGNVLKFAPNQTGTFRVQDEIAGRFSINANGWNSGKAAYLEAKSTPRIIIIGDSYLSAFQVDADSSIAEELEVLGQGSFEVYRFGIDGAPLSQYLHILREEALRFKPDLVIFNLVHNDFTESYEYLPGVYTSAFMRLDIKEGEVVREIAPKAYSPQWYLPIRRSNIWRYVAVRRQVRFQTLRNLLLPPRTAEKPQYEANINVRALEDRARLNRVATKYVFEQAKDLCEKNGARFMVSMDGVRSLIYATPRKVHDRTRGALQLNAIAESAAETLNIPFVDLHPVFLDHYLQHFKNFEFKHDGHWNALGHAIAARAIMDDLTARAAVPGQ